MPAIARLRRGRDPPLVAPCSAGRILAVDATTRRGVASRAHKRPRRADLGRLRVAAGRFIAPAAGPTTGPGEQVGLVARLRQAEGSTTPTVRDGTGGRLCASRANGQCVRRRVPCHACCRTRSAPPAPLGPTSAAEKSAGARPAATTSGAATQPGSPACASTQHRRVDWPNLARLSPPDTPRSRHADGRQDRRRPPRRAACASSPGPAPDSRSPWTTRRAAPLPARPSCSSRRWAAAPRWTSRASSRRSARWSPATPSTWRASSATPTRMPSGRSRSSTRSKARRSRSRQCGERSSSRRRATARSRPACPAARRELHHRYAVISPERAHPVEGEAAVTGPGLVLPPDEG